MNVGTNTKRLVLGVALACGLLLAASPGPVEAAPRYGSCASLKKAFPDGVAVSRVAAALAVSRGFGRPVVSRAAFTANKNLGQGGLGFICATRVPAPTPTPTPTPTAQASITYPVKITVTQSLLLPGGPDLSKGSSYCVSGQYVRPNFNDGTQVVIKDATGVIVATTALSGGTASNAFQQTYDPFYTYYDCTWTSTVTVPPSPFYTVSVGGRTNTVLSQADIATDGTMIYIVYNYSA